MDMDRVLMRQTDTGAARHTSPVYIVGGSSAAAKTPQVKRANLPRTLASARRVKRVVDIMGATAAIVLFGPLMLVVTVLLALQGGPVIFAHERIGRDGKPFRCLKFRTMAPNAEKMLAALLESDPVARREWESDHKLRRDPRTTRLGSLLRETSLDELPQFFNVLSGDMSLVGPRPITASEVGKYGDKFAFYINCRPGITGVWQVSGRNNLSYDARVDLDAHYARSQSLSLDIRIMLKTFGVVLSKIGAH